MIALRIALLMSCAYGLGTPALAQSSGPEPEPLAAQEDPPDIVVTATLRRERLADVPVAITALTGEQLNRSGITDATRLAEIVPSLTYTQSSNALNSSIRVRGIGTQVFSSGVEPSVSTIIDGVVLARQGQGFQDLIDIERIEVLRGPQGTLFGKNASAGVVNIVTQSPSNSFGMVLDAELADDGAWLTRGSVTGPISDTLSARVSGFYKEFDGHIKNFATGEQINGYENWGVRGKLQWESGPLKLVVAGDYSRQQSDCCQHQIRALSTAPAGAAAGYGNAMAPVIPGTGNNQVNVDGDVFSRDESWGVSLNGQLQIGGSVLTSITAYREWDFLNNVDVDSTALAAPILGVNRFNVNLGGTTLSQFSQELRIATPTGKFIEFVGGLYYFNLDLERSFERRVEACLAGNPCTSQIAQSGKFGGGVQNQNLAAFGQAAFNVAPDLQLILGGRVLYERMEYSILRDPSVRLVPGDVALGGSAGTFADIDDSTDDAALIGTLGVGYRIAPRANAYFTYSRGYKGKAFDVGFNTLQTSQVVAPEMSDAFEAGLKAQMLSNALSVNLAVFSTKYSNFQAQVSIPGDIAAQLRNVGAVRTRGVEVEFTARPSDTVTFGGGITYLDARILNFLGGPCYAGQTIAQGCNIAGGRIQDLTNATLPNAPEWRILLNGRKEFPVGAAGARLFAQANMTWQDDVQFGINQDPSTVQNGYVLVNTSVGYEAPDRLWGLTLFVNNLFDVSYSDGIGSDAIIGNAANGFAIDHFIPRGAERRFGARASLRF